MKLRIAKALQDGYNVLKKNPVILIPALFSALLAVYIATYTTAFRMAMITMLPIFLTTFVPMVIIAFLLNIFLGGMVIKMVFDARRKISLSKAAKFVASKYIILLIASIIYIIIIMLGFVAFIIPGIFLMVKLFFYQYSILIDNKGVVSSLKQSWKITKKNWWRLFAIVIILGIISSIISQLILLLPIFVSPVVSFIIYLFLTPWILAVFTSAYLQLRR